MKRNFIFLIDFNLEMTFMIDCYDTFVVKQNTNRSNVCSFVS